MAKIMRCICCRKCQSSSLCDYCADGTCAPVKECPIPTTVTIERRNDTSEAPEGEMTKSLILITLFDLLIALNESKIITYFALKGAALIYKASREELEE